MKNSTRLNRINEEIKAELSRIFQSELKDPRIGVMTSVVSVNTTPDLKYSKIGVSVLGNDEERKNVMDGIKNANGYIRHLIAERVNLRITPELIFKIDDSMEYAVKMSKLIDEVTKKSSFKQGDENE